MVVFASILSPDLIFFASIDFDSSAGIVVPGATGGAVSLGSDAGDAPEVWASPVNGLGDVCDSIDVAPTGIATRNQKKILWRLMDYSPFS